MDCDALNCIGIISNLAFNHHNDAFCSQAVTKSLRILISMWHFTGYMRIYFTGIDKVVNWRKGFPGATQTCAVGEPLAGMAYS